MFTIPIFVFTGFGNITPKTPLGQGVTIIFCLLGIPITMLAMKTSGELLATGIRFLVIKTDTVVLKRAEPKHIKGKTFFLSSALIVFLQLILACVSTSYIETDWSFLESLYAWFTTFTTIGFGDYVHMESFSSKTAHGEMSKARLIFYGILLSLPYVAGLSLMSCILTCLVDSVDQIRRFRDRCMKYCPSLNSLISRLLSREQSSYNVRAEDSYRSGQSQEMS